MEATACQLPAQNKYPGMTLRRKNIVFSGLLMAHSGQRKNIVVSEDSLFIASVLVLAFSESQKEGFNKTYWRDSWKLYKQVFICNFSKYQQITTKFCTCTDSIAVSACTKFCGDQACNIQFMIGIYRKKTFTKTIPQWKCHHQVAVIASIGFVDPWLVEADLSKYFAKLTWPAS